MRRIVPVVALASRGPDSTAAALVRLNAITASTSHAEFAANDFDVILSLSQGFHDVHDTG